MSLNVDKLFGVIYVQNETTAVGVGEALGVQLLVIFIFEYSAHLKTMKQTYCCIEGSWLICKNSKTSKYG